MRLLFTCALWFFALVTALVAGRTVLIQHRIPLPNATIVYIATQYHNPTSRYPIYGRTDLFAVDLGNSPRRLFLNPELETSLGTSPTGEIIAFTRNFQIFTVSYFGGREKQLTDCNGLNNYPDWSPDGRWIVYESTCDSSGQPFYNHISVMRADGSGKRQLTAPEMNVVGFQKWSPDGQWIVFVARDVDADGVWLDDEIYRIRPDGSGLQRLTDNSYNDSFPTWSPDGTWLAFIASHNPAAPYTAQIFRMQADGSAVQQLTFAPHSAISPDISPDGQWIVYTENIHNGVIHKMRADGSDDRVLYPKGWLPQWSPDGNYILFLKNKRILTVIDTAGKTETPLNITPYHHPVWLKSPATTYTPQATAIAAPAAALLACLLVISPYRKRRS